MTDDDGLQVVPGRFDIMRHRYANGLALDVPRRPRDGLDVSWRPRDGLGETGNGHDDLLDLATQPTRVAYSLAVSFVQDARRPYVGINLSKSI